MPPVLWKLLVLALIVGVGSAGHSHLLAQPAAAPAVANPPLNAGQAFLEESPFLVEPKTPDEFFDSTVMSVRLARPNLARKYLQGLMDLNPDDDALLKLRDKNGPAVFLKLANVPELRPLSTELLDRVNIAFRRRGADPARIGLIIKDLGGTAQQRDVAVVTLRSAGAVVVPEMLKLLANPSPGIDRDLIVDTLVKMGNPVIPPLIGAINTPDENLRATVIQVLGFLGDRSSAAYLWFPAFGPDQPAGVQQSARSALARIFRAPENSVRSITPLGVAKELQRLATEHYRLQHEWALGEDKLVEYWDWSPEARTVVARSLPPEAASLNEGTRFARQALAMSPESRELQSLFLGLALSSESYTAGWDRPLPTGPATAHDLALSSGGEAVSDALASALASGNARGAVAALQVLGQVGTQHQLQKTASRDAPVITALNYPDPRVQFAAAMAVLQLDPSDPFRGSERVVAILSRALNDSGHRHCLAVHSNIQTAGTTAGLFGELGYEPRTAQTGREAFTIASESADIELIILDLNITRWELSQTVANLRADARTAGIPIIVSGPEENRTKVLSQLKRYPLVTYLVNSATSDNIRLQLQNFFQSFRSPPVSTEMRAEQASAAAFWLAHLATSQRQKIYALGAAEKSLIAAADDPALTVNAVRALGVLASRDAQQLLQSIALNVQAAVEHREAAAAQLAYSIQRHGLLLSLEEVSAIEQAWRGETDPTVSTALAAIVGSLKPNAQRVSGRLQRFAAPPPSPPVP